MGKKDSSGKGRPKGSGVKPGPGPAAKKAAFKKAAPRKAAAKKADPKGQGISQERAQPVPAGATAIGRGQPAAKPPAVPVPQPGHPNASGPLAVITPRPTPVTRLEPVARTALFNRALQQFQAGSLPDAIAICADLIAADPEDFDALHLGGVVALRQGDQGRALELIERAVRRRPEDPQAQQNLGALFARQGRLGDAEACFRRALALDPGLADANANLGLALASQGRHAEAIVCYRQALARDPHHAEAWSRLGLALAREHKLEEAIPCFRQAVAIRPGYGEAMAFLYHQLQHACDWAELPFLGARLDRSTQIALAKGLKPGEPPFVSISRSMDPARNYAVAKAASEETAQRMRALGASFPIAHPRAGRRIVLGYLSGDYRNHPVAHLLGGLFAAHDRARFQVNAYSYGADDASGYRRRAEREADSFVDLRRASSLDAARRIYADEVDILVDLT